jgi:hypothetical protein
MMQRTLVAVAGLAMLASACSGAGTSDSPASTGADTNPPQSSAAPSGADVVVFSGSIEVPAAGAFGDSGFHEPFNLSGTVPESASGVAGDLVVRLFDVGRPNQTCEREHPLSGCATVDWSDFENRPGVPAGGVFENRLSIVSASGAADLFLSETRGLAVTPDQYSPT